MSARRPGFRIQEDLLLPFSPRETVSVDAVCRMLSCGRFAVRKLIEEGKIEAYKIRPHSRTCAYRINYNSVVRYLEEVHRESGLEKRF
jgi:excisionase family DNA binding protein